MTVRKIQKLLREQVVVVRQKDQQADRKEEKDCEKKGGDGKEEGEGKDLEGEQ